MRVFFEFNNHGYYALITVTSKRGENLDSLIRKSAEIYVEQVAGDSVSEVLEKGNPEQVTIEKAFYRWVQIAEKHTPIGEVAREFDTSENCVLVIDGLLV